VFFYFLYEIFLIFLIFSRILSYFRFLGNEKILRKLVDKMKSKSNYKSIDLFAGIGGIRLGFEQAFGDDIETVFISEFDVKADNYQFNNSCYRCCDCGTSCTEFRKTEVAENEQVVKTYVYNKG
jgi:hypothetical protein